jgi:drug/metabolite transporter (DMT)-like permease
MNEKQRAYLAWVIVCLVWGTTYLGIRIALETVPPFLMTAFRWLAAGSLLVLGLILRQVRLPGRREYLSLAMMGALLLGVGNGAVVWAEQSVPSGLTAVLVGAVPFWMVGLDRVVGDSRERLPPSRVAGLMVGFAGIVLLVWPELRFDASGDFLTGVIATQLACLGWAIGSSYSRRRGRDENVLAAAALQMLFAGAILLVVATARREWALLTFTPRTSAALIYLVLIGSVIGFSAYAYALKYLPVATVSLYAYVNPVIAVLLGTLILDEPFSARVAVAGAIVLLGMAMVRERPTGGRERRVT